MGSSTQIDIIEMLA